MTGCRWTHTQEVTTSQDSTGLSCAPSCCASNAARRHKCLPALNVMQAPELSINRCLRLQLLAPEKDLEHTCNAVNALIAISKDATICIQVPLAAYLLKSRRMAHSRASSNHVCILAMKHSGPCRQCRPSPEIMQIKESSAPTSASSCQAAPACARACISFHCSVVAQASVLAHEHNHQYEQASKPHCLAADPPMTRAPSSSQLRPSLF